MLNICSLLFCFSLRPIKGKQEKWKTILEKFRATQDYNRTYKALTSPDSLSSSILANRSKPQIDSFKHHVYIYLYFYKDIFIEAILYFSKFFVASFF